MVSVGMFLLLVAAALVGVEAKKTILFGISKTAATASLTALVGVPHGRFAWHVVGGLALATIGDAVLVSDKPRAFMLGLVLFLLAHISYALGFLSGVTPGDLGSMGKGGVIAAAAGLAVFAASAALVWRLWQPLGPALHRPMVAYALAISAMTALAFLTVLGPWPANVVLSCATGALLFYLSDSNLAWNRFGRPYPHHQTVTLCLYWAGQLGIALAARWVSGSASS